ncbi:MAG: cytochrome c maturation protein CcmE [Acetobacteraceae bacterium]|nr:cytochrome c maturation protein CcmE [Acetobacteraceae bacterium]
MTRKHRRLLIVLVFGACIGSAVALTLIAFNDNLVFFVSPSDLSKMAVNGRTLRLGGLVEPGSVVRGEARNAGTTFRVTDGANSVVVTFKGIVPDLFREGQGVVTLGALRPDGTFLASEVLAKHDENYMPKEVAEALKKSGQWKSESEALPARPLSAPFGKTSGG